MWWCGLRGGRIFFPPFHPPPPPPKSAYPKGFSQLCFYHQIPYTSHLLHCHVHNSSKTFFLDASLIRQDSLPTTWRSLATGFSLKITKLFLTHVSLRGLSDTFVCDHLFWSMTYISQLCGHFFLKVAPVYVTVYSCY